MKIRLGKNKSASIWYIASGLIIKATGFLSTSVITRLLLPDEFGIYTLYSGILSIVTVFQTLEIAGNGIYRELSLKDDHNPFLYSLLIFSFSVSLLFMGIYIPLRRPISEAAGLAPLSVAVLIMQVFLNCAESIHLASLRYGLKYKSASFTNMAIGVLTPLLSIALILGTSLGGYARIYAPLFVSAVMVIPMIIHICQSAKWKLDKSAFSYIGKRLIPLLPHYVSLSVIAQSGRVVIAKRLGQAFVGKYGAAQSFAFAITLVTVGILGAFFPWLNRNFSKENFTRVITISKKCVLTVSVFATAFMLFSNPLFNVFASNEYKDALVCVYPLVIYCTLSFCSSIYTQILYRVSSTACVSVISILTAVFTTVSSLFLCDGYGIFGVACALLFGEALSLLIKAWLLKSKDYPCHSISLVPLMQGIVITSLIFFF